MHLFRIKVLLYIQFLLVVPFTLLSNRYKLNDLHQALKVYEFLMEVFLLELCLNIRIKELVGSKKSVGPQW